MHRITSSQIVARIASIKKPNSSSIVGKNGITTMPCDCDLSFIEEIDMLQTSLQQLKMAQSRFIESSDSIGKLKPEDDGKQILVPLTSSLYVPGNLSDVNSVLIDIGTGYYVEKTLPKAKEYMKRKIDFVTKQMEKVQPILIEKSKMRQIVGEVMNIKIQAEMSARQQAQAVK